ncbi:MAG TPA: sulfotransferase [Caulobacterales bacterium]|nr:sulfotransferase [Caulobacterales bacterium]
MTDPRTHVRAALAAFEARNRDAAAAEIRTLLAMNAPLGNTWGQLSRMAALLGEARLAVEAARRHAGATPDDPGRQLELAAACARFGREEEALAVAKGVAARNPTLPGAHYLVGLSYAHLGETEPALASLREAIRIRPDVGDAWVVLATLKKFAADDPELQKLRALCESQPMSVPEVQGSLHLALGKAWDDVGDVDRAFAAYATGARVYAQKQPYNPGLDEAFASALTKTYDKNFEASLAPSGNASDRPIFVVGLPRSGTTLLQEILTAHSAVSSGGEPNLLGPALMELEDRLTPVEIRRHVQSERGAGVWARGAASYLHLLNERFGGEGRIVDKSLSHSPIVGLIRHVLPKAPVLWIRRDPADIAWSCFRTRFAEGMTWSWSLTGMARRFRVEDQLYDFWTQYLGDQVLTIPYEGLVNDPETWIPKVLAHCGLADEPGTRSFHTLKRVVKTASMAQVRQPLHNRSVGGWRRYEKHLEPFLRTYRGG